MYYFISFCLIIYIVGGNALSISLMGTTFKLGELLLIGLGAIMTPKIKIETLNRPFRYLIGWAVLSLFLIFINTFIYSFTLLQSIKAFMYLFRLIFIIYTAYLVSIYLKKNNKILNSLELINACYLIVCLIGFYQLSFYPVANDWYNIFSIIGVRWYGDPHINRLVSTDFDPNYLACCLLIGITINLYLWSKNKERRLYYFFSLIIFVISILLTKSRSGLLGLLIVVVLYWWLSINLRNIKLTDVVIFFGIIFIGGYLFLFSNISVFVRIRTMFNDPSALARFSSWKKSFEIIYNTKFIGIGYNYYGSYNEKFYGAIQSNSSAGVDSSLLMLLITTGVLGFILFMIHFVKSYKLVKHKAIKALMLATLVVCNFNNLIFYSLFLLPFYLIYFNISFYERNYITKKEFATNTARLLIIKNSIERKLL